VVQVYDFVEDPAGDAIILEYVEGRTLRALLAEGVPSVAQAVRLALEIAEGLAAAHAAGLVHRDLKPENVVITLKGHAKILDFGIAKVPEGGNLTAQGVVLGTAHAMSPEQARGGEVDSRSDLFSLGILLYELLTGFSPFRGSNPLDELQRVISHMPQPVFRLRPEIPRALSALVDRLLAKRREDRPHSAGEVARELASLPVPPAIVTEGLGLPGTTGSTVAELPAIFVPDEATVLSGTTPHGQRLPVLLLSVLLATLVLSLGWYLWPSPTEPLRIVVIEPKVAAGATLGEDSDLLASGLLHATRSNLASLEGLSVLDTSSLEPVTNARDFPVAAARSTAAAEAIVLGLERQSGGIQASLRRIAGIDGQVLWAVTFPVPASPSDRDLRLLDDAVSVQLRQAYPDHRRRPGLSTLAVSDHGYAELVRIKSRIKRNMSLSPETLEREIAKAGALVRDSPRFLEGHLLVSDLARRLFSSRGKPADIDRGLSAAAIAAALAPGDPRPIKDRFFLNLDAGRHDEAEEALKELSRIVPGDPQIHAYAGGLARRRGNLDRATAEYSKAAQAVPSWRNLLTLAEVGNQAGRIDVARRALKDLLARDPGGWSMAIVAQIEMIYGDPHRAELIYLDLLRQAPHYGYFTNLGVARTFLGRYADAVEAFRRALALNPDDPIVLVNLADSEFTLGRRDEARRLYSRALASLEQAAQAGPLSPRQRMRRAKCLAYLDRTPEAVEITQQVIRESGDDPEVLFKAALIYTMAGDHASALVNAEAALEKGMPARWFSQFGLLSYDPKIQALLAQDQPR
jgi:serine/threonine-protein kinase